MGRCRESYHLPPSRPTNLVSNSKAPFSLPLLLLILSNVFIDRNSNGHHLQRFFLLSNPFSSLFSLSPFLSSRRSPSGLPLSIIVLLLLLLFFFWTAAVAWGPGEPLVLEEVEVDPPMPMEIRVKIVCTSLCRSDITHWESKAQHALFPRIFGHEASGIVESVGEGVTEFEVGDHILTVFIGECKRCKHCVSGRSNMCQVLGLERKGVMHTDQKTRFSIKGRPIYHYCAVSSFSEYTVVHSGCAVKVGPSAPMDRICLLSCGVAAGLGAAWKVADVSKGSTVVVFGLGTVGLSVAQGASLRGASQVIGVDTDPQKYEKGKSFGVTKYINPDECSEPIQQVIKCMTDGGADYCFECIGDTGMVSTALQSCCDGWGLTVTLGVPKVKLEVSSHYALLLSGRTLKGSLFGGWRPKSDLPLLVDKYLRKIQSGLVCTSYITHISESTTGG